MIIIEKKLSNAMKYKPVSLMTAKSVQDVTYSGPNGKSRIEIYKVLKTFNEISKLSH